MFKVRSSNLVGIIWCRHPRPANDGQKTLSLVWSASACETNWSTWEYVVDKRRNRLAVDKAIKLVGINANLRMIQNMEKTNFNYDSDSE